MLPFAHSPGVYPRADFLGVGRVDLLRLDAQFLKRLLSFSRVEFAVAREARQRSGGDIRRVGFEVLAEVF